MSFNTELTNNWTYQWKMSFTKQLDLSMEMSFYTETTGLINGRCPLTLNLPYKQLDLSMEDVL